VVATKRAEEDVTIPRSATIAIGPLDLAAVAEIVGEERAPSMWRRTGGNALLVVELAAMESPDVGTSIDIDESNDESIEATGTAAGASRTAVPTAIRRAVAERLRRAGASAMTVRTAAVLGPVVDLDLLSGVLGASPLEVLADLDDATRRGFLEESDGQMVFRHELVRAAAEAEATAARRAWVHRTAATLLAARADVNPLELARHARAGGDLATAAAALADAADVARARFDLPGAERLLDAAVTAHDDADLRLRRSRLRLARNDLEGADLDAAAALGLGAFASHLVVSAEFIAKIPESLSFADAATIPRLLFMHCERT